MPPLGLVEVPPPPAILSSLAFFEVSDNKVLSFMLICIYRLACTRLINYLCHGIGFVGQLSHVYVLEFFNDKINFHILRQILHQTCFNDFSKCEMVHEQTSV